MAGYILSTGTGILAAGAVYYTLSDSLQKSVASLRTDLDASSSLLDASFDPQAPPAPSSLVGPSYPNQPRFSDTLRQRWNLAITKGVGAVRETDFAAAGMVVVTEARKLGEKLGPEVRDVAQEVTHKLEDDAHVIADELRKVGEKIEDGVEAKKRGVEGLNTLGGGLVGGDLRNESFTGGPEVVVRAKRQIEKNEGKRLV